MCPDCKDTGKYIGFNVVEDCHCVKKQEYRCEISHNGEHLVTLSGKSDPLTNRLIFQPWMVPCTYDGFDIEIYYGDKLLFGEHQKECIHYGVEFHLTCPLELINA